MSSVGSVGSVVTAPLAVQSPDVGGQDHLQNLFLLQLGQAQGSSPQLLHGSAQNAGCAKCVFWVQLSVGQLRHGLQAVHTPCVRWRIPFCDRHTLDRSWEFCCILLQSFFADLSLSVSLPLLHIHSLPFFPSLAFIVPISQASSLLNCLTFTLSETGECGLCTSRSL